MLGENVQIGENVSMGDYCCIGDNAQTVPFAGVQLLEKKYILRLALA